MSRKIARDNGGRVGKTLNAWATRVAARIGAGSSAAVTAVAWALVGWSFGEAVGAFVVSNLVIGLSFGACGALVAWYRPAHPVGWLYLVGGLCETLSAASAPLAQVSLDRVTAAR